jgi:diaminobutyrate-2-oxoglutarate transaminase
LTISVLPQSQNEPAKRRGTSQQIFAYRESGVQSYARVFPALFTKAKGAAIWDSRGKRYLDFLAGAGSLNYGHNNPFLKEALLSYLADDGITHSLDLHTAAKEKFLTALNDVILEPLGLDYVVQFTGPTGTNAVEAALKIARKITGRTNVVCFTNGFHGVSMGSLALTGNSYFRQAAGLPLQGTTAMPYDGYFGPTVDTVDYLERMLGDPASGIDHPAAIILETVQGEGGLTAARAAWMRRLATTCKQKGILLIVDDIQAGCGRTNSFFSFTQSGLRPDIVTLSKSLSGYGLPMSIVLIRRDCDVWRPGEHNGTFRGNNHAFVTGATALEYYWRTPHFAAELQAKSERLDDHLNRFVQKYPDEIITLRGRGMMRGICCKEPSKVAAITAEAFARGLIIERSGPYDEVIKFLAPLTIELSELDEGMEILDSAFEHVLEASSRERKQALAPVHQSCVTKAVEANHAPDLPHG